MAKMIINVKRLGLSVDGDQKFSLLVEIAFCSIFYELCTEYPEQVNQQWDLSDSLLFDFWIKLILKNLSPCFDYQVVYCTDTSKMYKHVRSSFLADSWIYHIAWSFVCRTTLFFFTFLEVDFLFICSFRLRELKTLKGHFETVVRRKGLDIDTIQQAYTV